MARDSENSVQLTADRGQGIAVLLFLATLLSTAAQAEDVTNSNELIEKGVQAVQAEQQIHYNLAQVYLRANPSAESQKPHWQKKAIEHLQFVLEREPENPNLHLELGMAYFNTANPGGGIEEFDKASQLAKEPRWVWIHERIRDYYLQVHLLDRAEQEEANIQKMKGKTEGRSLL